jgi:glutaminyl-peptide cyclotransferase
MARLRADSDHPTPSSHATSRWAKGWMVGGGLGFVLLAIVAIVWLNMFNHWSNGAEPPGKKKGDEFASDRDASATDPVAFDGKRAMGYLEAICKIGPRISGSDGMKKQQELLEKHFKDLGGKIEWQRFEAKQRSRRDKVEMANLIVSWNPDKERRIIICAHYDTRPIADQERERRNWTEPFLSANDGGSGVALMMELAHAMKDVKTNVGVDFVLFDGEEYIFEPGDFEHPRDDYFIGSKHFAVEYRKKRDKIKYLGAVLLDMIGGKDPHFPMEPYSYTKAGALTERIWQIAEDQKCTAFKNVISETQVEDDHIALNNAGIPAVDIIDFSYKHWHKLSDVPENCSADGLEQVARVLGVWMQREK